MAISKYSNEHGEKLYSVYVNMRSRVMPHIRLQRRARGMKTKAEALRKERNLYQKLSAEIAIKEGHGLPWRLVVKRWEVYAKEAKFLDKPYNPATIQDYVSMMNNWTRDWLDLPASQLNRGDGREVLDRVIRNGRTKAFQKRLKNTINMIYNWGIEERLIREVHTSPVSGLKITVKQYKRPQVLKIDEIRKLLRKAKKDKHKWYSIWAVALLTGMRNGELFALKWSDVDFSNKQITVQRSYNKRTKEFKSTKSGYWRMIPISSELNVTLKSLYNPYAEFVLPRLKDWLGGQQSRILKEYCRLIGITAIRFHSLRACFATQLINSGVEPIKVMKICGWRDLKTMAYYLSMTGVDERGVTDRLKFLK